MAEETAEQKLARLEAENRALKEQVEQRRSGQLAFENQRKRRTFRVRPRQVSSYSIQRAVDPAARAD